MTIPTANIERDASFKCYEVVVETDDERHDLFKILFFDDGRTELQRWTYGELVEELATAITAAVEEAVPRLR